MSLLCSYQYYKTSYSEVQLQFTVVLKMILVTVLTKVVTGLTEILKANNKFVLNNYYSHLGLLMICCLKIMFH